MHQDTSPFLHFVGSRLWKSVLSRVLENESSRKVVGSTLIQKRNSDDKIRRDELRILKIGALRREIHR